MKRRPFFMALATAILALAWPRGVIKPPSVFAAKIRQSARRLNRSGGEHTERRLIAEMPYVVLEDMVAFHRIAEDIRLAMIEQLRERGAPINVWRVGMMGGTVDSRIDYRTRETKDWQDSHTFYVRTRVSVETPPFTHPA